MRFSIIYDMHPLGKVRIEWSNNFAYAIGLIATDGNLSKDGRHINLTSKDLEMLMNFKKCLGLENKIGRKARGGSMDKKYFVLQFGDRIFYDFLLSLGLTPRKSLTLGELAVPDQFFSNFLRGCIDGDGSIGSFKHPESKHPQLRVRLYSGSKNFLLWIKDRIMSNFNIDTGWIEEKGKTRIYKLVFAKEDSIKLLKFIYSNSNCSLTRKYDIAKIYI